MTIDIAIINGTVLPMGGAKPIENGVVTITGGAITAVGPADAVDIRGARKVVDASLSEIGRAHV